ADAYYRKRGTLRLLKIIRVVPVTMQPQTDAPRRSHFEQIRKVAQPVGSVFRAAAGHTDRIVRHQNAWSRFELIHKLGQALALLRADAAARVKWPKIAGAAVHCHQMHVANTLGKGIGAAVHANTVHPRSEKTLEVARRGSGSRAIVMVTRYRQARRH